MFWTTHHAGLYKHAFLTGQHMMKEKKIDRLEFSS